MSYNSWPADRKGKAERYSAVAKNIRNHKPRNSAAFQELQREWYAKLAATGHQDIEYFRDDAGTIMARHQLFDRDAEQRGQRGEGQQMAAVNELPNHATFGSLMQRVIVGLYNQGVSKEGILKGLAGLTRPTLRSTAHRTIETARKAARALARSGVLWPEEEDTCDVSGEK